MILKVRIVTTILIRVVSYWKGAQRRHFMPGSIRGEKIIK